MALDPKELQKPLSKLRKLLKKIPKQSTPGQVHDLRTHSRRVEATVEALQLDRNRKGKQLLKTITPMRKRAGRVRDLDVLTGFAAGLASNGDQEAVTQLLEHLGESRFKAARRLHKSVVKRRRTANKRLKRCSSLLDRNHRGSRKRRFDEWRASATADALKVSSDIAGWPQLTKENLHPFRLKVKELRNVLRMTGKDDDLVDQLGDVKDAIGEWHDWMVLSAITKDALGKSESRSLVQQIGEITKQKEQRALESSNRLRNRYFNGGKKKDRHSRAEGVPELVLKSAAKLAEPA